MVFKMVNNEKLFRRMKVKMNDGPQYNQQGRELLAGDSRVCPILGKAIANRVRFLRNVQKQGAIAKCQIFPLQYLSFLF